MPRGIHAQRSKQQISVITYSSIRPQVHDFFFRRATSSMNIITAAEITDNDVLLGRGKGVHMHEGNIRFRKLVAERASASLPLGRERQTEACREAAIHIINVVRDKGGRFLKPCCSEQQQTAVDAPAQQCWGAVGIVATLAKVRQALRDTRSKAQRVEKQRQQARHSPIVASIPPTVAIRQLQDSRPTRNSEHSSSRQPADFPERPRSHRDEQEKLRLLAILRAQQQQQIRQIELLRTEQLLAARTTLFLQGPIDTRLPPSAETSTSAVLPLLFADRARQLHQGHLDHVSSMYSGT